jgi:hypothetical protein
VAWRLSRAFWTYLGGAAGFADFRARWVVSISGRAACKFAIAGVVRAVLVVEGVVGVEERAGFDDRYLIMPASFSRKPRPARRPDPAE